MPRETLNPGKTNTDHYFKEINFKKEYVANMKERLAFAEFMLNEGYIPDSSLATFAKEICPYGLKYEYNCSCFRLIVRRIPLEVKAYKHYYLERSPLNERIEGFTKGQEAINKLIPKMEKIEELVRLFKKENKGVGKSVFTTNGITYYFDGNNNQTGRILFKSSKSDSYSKNFAIQIRVKDNEIYLESTEGLENKLVCSKNVFGKEAADKVKITKDEKSIASNLFVSSLDSSTKDREEQETLEEEEDCDDF